MLSASTFLMRSTFLHAEWRKLAIANYVVDPAILKPYIPSGTELDFWNSRCYVSLVGFRFINTKLRGLAIPFHINFEEINLRFYVKYFENGKWRRGVTFIKEIVRKPALSFVANSVYKEKYITLPTRHAWSSNAADIRIAYEWKHRGAWDTIAFTAQHGSQEIVPGSKEEFITEHYWGYTQGNNTRTSQYQVEHPRWQVYPVNSFELNVRFEELYGKPFGVLNDAQPDSVMLAEGSKVTIRMFDRIT